MIEPRLK